MQLNAVLPTSRGLRCVGAGSRRVLPRPVGLTSFGVRRARSVASRSTSTVRVGCPSFGGQRTVSARSWSGALGASGASVVALSAKGARAVCPSWCGQALRTTARCPSAAALSARRGRGGVERVALSLASCNGGCLGSFGASKLTVVNASLFIGCSAAKSAPNPSVKRTAPGVPGSAAYLKR